MRIDERERKKDSLKNYLKIIPGIDVNQNVDSYQDAPFSPS